MIEINDLSHRYPDGKIALDSVSLDIKKGEFVVIAGRNGSGKSTLVQHMNALLLPLSGSVEVEGLCTSKRENIPQIRRKVGMVFQNPDSQFVGMTVEEDIAFGLENTGVETQRIRMLVDSVLDSMGLSGYKKYTPRILSGGQKQKVAIAGVLVMEPECVIFDEITSMLDPASREEILATIKGINEKGTTVVHITHRLEEAVDADRLVVMDSGKIVLDGVPDKVLANRELLQEHGLRLPPLLELSMKLSDAGIIRKGVLSEDELVEELCRSM